MMRIGNGIDVHAFSGEAHRPLVLAGVTVEAGPGLAGHSDADVVAHAVIDALLGAAALGDLGERFGVDLPEVAGADSLGLLRGVVAELAVDEQQVGNVDVTVVAQRPRLGPYRDQMRANLADALRVDLAAVSVKFTTTDRLGSIGHGEGVAAFAACLLVDGHR